MKNTLETLKITTSPQGSMNTAAQAKMTETQAPAQSATAGTQTSSTAGIHMHETITSLTGSETNHNGHMFDEDFLADGYTADDHDRREGKIAAEEAAEEHQEKTEAGKEETETRAKAKSALDKAWAEYMALHDPQQEDSEEARAKWDTWRELKAALDHEQEKSQQAQNGAAGSQAGEEEAQAGAATAEDAADAEGEDPFARMSGNTMEPVLRTAFFGSLLKRSEFAKKLLSIEIAAPPGRRHKKSTEFLFTPHMFSKNDDLPARMFFKIMRDCWDQFNCIPREDIIAHEIDRRRGAGELGEEGITAMFEYLQDSLQYHADPSQEEWILDSLTSYLTAGFYPGAAENVTSRGRGETAESNHAALCSLMDAIKQIKAPAPPKEKKYSLLEIADVELDPTSTLLGDGYLERTDFLIFGAPTGYGKSTTSLALAYGWSTGNAALGIPPNGPMRLLIVQNENGERDMQRQSRGGGASIHREPWFKADPKRYLDLVHQNTRIMREKTKVDDEFIAFLRAEIEEFKADKGAYPDMLIIDPITAYITIKPDDVGKSREFITKKLNPLLLQYNCGAILILPTNKSTANRESRKNTLASYLLSESAAWPNAARGVITIMPEDKDESGDLYRMTDDKRGHLLGWVDAQGKPVRYQILRRGTDTAAPCWTVVPAEQAAKTVEKKVLSSETLKAVVGALSGAGMIQSLAVRRRAKGSDKPWVAYLRKELLKAGVTKCLNGGTLTKEAIQDLVESLTRSGDWHWSKIGDFEYLSTVRRLKPGRPENWRAAEADAEASSKHYSEEAKSAASESSTAEQNQQMQMLLALLKERSVGTDGVRKTRKALQELAKGMTARGVRTGWKKIQDVLLPALETMGKLETRSVPVQGKKPEIHLVLKEVAK